MSLRISRKAGQSFKVTWPSGFSSTVECVGVNGQLAIIDGTPRRLPTTIFSPNDHQICMIAGDKHRNLFNVTSFSITAPESVTIHRDDIKNKERNV